MEQRMLVYEFISNGTILKYLHDTGEFNVRFG